MNGSCHSLRHATSMNRAGSPRPPRRVIHGLALAGLFGLVLSPAALPADDFPNGCVSCHVVLPDGADKRLAAVLGEIGHVSLKGKVSQVPTDCIACHEKKVDTKFSVLIHQAHFGSPDKNLFVQHFGGDCRHCHVMDAESGEPKVKAGDANW